MDYPSNIVRIVSCSCLVYAFMSIAYIGTMIGMIVGAVINAGLAVLFFCCYKKGGKLGGNSDGEVALMAEAGGEVEVEIVAPEVEIEIEAPEVEVEVEVEAEVEIEVEVPEVEVEAEVEVEIEL